MEKSKEVSNTTRNQVSKLAGKQVSKKTSNLTLPLLTLLFDHLAAS